MAQHRIELREAVAHLPQALRIGAHICGQLANLLVVLGQEFMQRRIEQPDRHRLARHLAQDCDEIRALHRDDLFERARPLLGDSPPGSFRAPRRSVRARRTYARCGTVRSPRRQTRSRSSASPGVSALARTPRLRSWSAHFMNLRKWSDISGFDGRHAPRDHLAGRAVERDIFAALITRSPTLSAPPLVIDFERAAARHAAFAHAARDHRRMTGHAAARGQNALRHLHPVDILGRSFDAHENHRPPRADAR